MDRSAKESTPSDELEDGMETGKATLAELPPPPHHREAHLSIVAMLVALFTLCTWYFTDSSPRLAMTGLTGSRQREILDSTVKSLSDVFRWNSYGAKALVRMLEKDLLGDGASLESFSKIRAAAWSLFNAIPLITSIGVTSLNGLTCLYVRGDSHSGGELEMLRNGPIFVYTKSTEEYSPFYVESVNASTGEALEDPKEFFIDEHIKNMKWFRYALSVPVGEPAWQVERCQTSGRPYFHCGIPVLSNTLKQMAVVHHSLSTTVVSEHLSTSLDLKGVNIFVSNDVGDVLLTSEEQCPKRNSDIGGCTGESEVGEAVKFIRMQTHLKELVNKEIHYVDVPIGGRLFSIDSWYHSFEGVVLAVVIISPRHSFWRPIDTRSRFAWVTVSLLTLGLGFVAFRLIHLLLEGTVAHMKLRTALLHQIDAKRRAEASRDAKTAFLSHVSHELRTPMACIIGLLEILMGELKLSEYESSVKQVHRCATSLVVLLNSALDIAKVEAGKLELESAEFDLETELSSLIDMFSVQCDMKGLHLSLQLSDDIPHVVIGDPVRVMQIFTNLIGNSIKFTSQGRIIIRGWVDADGGEPMEMDCANETETPGDRRVVMKFEVDDTGAGIDQALRERVFENFVQGNASTPRTHGGTGLGLGIVRSLVHLMGGSIKIGDKIGCGALFQFSLCFDLPFFRNSPESERLKNRQIVLGMPEKDCRAVVAHWMEDRGLSVHQAGSWEDVLIHLKALALHLRGRKIDQIPQEDDLPCGKSCKEYKGRQCGEGSPWISGRCGIRRSKSEGTSGHPRLEKPVLVVDVDLLPPCLDEKAYLQTLVEIGFPLKTQSKKGHCTFHALVWVTASNTPAGLKRVLKLLRRSILVRRPLHASRLRDLFQQLAVRDQEFSRLGGIEEDLVPSSLSANISKQLDVLYTGDEEVPCGAQCVPGGPTSPPCTTCILGGPGLRSNNNDAVPNLDMAVNARHVAANPQGNRACSPLARSVSDNVASLLTVSRRKSTARALENLEILVAEDHPLLRRLAVTMLRKLGATPYEASNGEEVVSSVVSRWESGKPPLHCILMDCQMPVMDGYDACKAVREFEREKSQYTLIIALTANAMATDEQRCFRVGMNAFLSKPILQDHLTRVILSTLAPTCQREDETNLLEA